jgi:hypothetical protein
MSGFAVHSGMRRGLSMKEGECSRLDGQTMSTGIPRVGHGTARLDVSERMFVWSSHRYLCSHKAKRDEPTLATCESPEHIDHVQPLNLKSNGPTPYDDDALKRKNLVY